MPSWALNNITVPDAYAAAGTLEQLPVLEHVNLDVSNGAIYWSLKQASNLTSPETGTWQTEVFMATGSRTLRRIGMVGIRVRAAVPGSGARVTVEAVEA